MAKQNTKLSGYNPNRRPSSIPSYLGLPRISSWKKFANLFEPDTPNKLKCDCFCTGRSMVEMLGVLAIIGVLSVGAIAGYSKAMMKYKLNKHAEDLNLLLANCLQLSKQLPTDNVWKVYTSILPKLNLLPDSVKAYPDGNMRDIFKNTLYFYHTSAEGRWGIFHDIPESSYGNEICVNIIKTTKEYHAELYGVYRSKNHVSDSPTGYGMSEQYLGDKYCNHTDKKCISDMTISDIHNLCADKGENAGDFNQYFLWITWYPADF